MKAKPYPENVVKRWDVIWHAVVRGVWSFMESWLVHDSRLLFFRMPNVPD